ncbi:RNA methyltransferase [bacterium]|nr:RNA methyltransferase [bacterium]
MKRKKVRQAEDRFIVEGLRTCEELLASSYDVETLLHCPIRFNGARELELISAFRSKGVRVLEIDERSLQKVSDTTTAPGVLAIARTKAFAFPRITSNDPSILLALDRIREPGNVGTIVRTANWFGVSVILMGAGSAEFTNPKVIRSSMGAVFHMPIYTDLDLSLKLAELKEKGYEIVAASLDGSKLYSEFEFSPQTVLLLGNETAGINDNLKALTKESLRIPKRGRGESINVAVAAGIMLSKMSEMIFA